MATLARIDHMHVYVPDREEAAQWFEDLLGLKVIERFRVWAADGGPLTIGDESDSIHLALFEKSKFTPSTAIAFGTDGKNFLEWKALLEKRGILDRCTDHDLAWSLYFHDPYKNMYEITTYDHEAVSQVLNG